MQTIKLNVKAKLRSALGDAIARMVKLGLMFSFHMQYGWK
jgi:hypothetical protein